MEGRDNWAKRAPGTPIQRSERMRLAPRRRRNWVVPAVIILAILILAAAGGVVWYFNLLPGRVYTAADFGIETLTSTLDQNGNGVDDYTDLLLGARADAQRKPRYDGAYHVGGYPPDDVGVCTDVVWRAFAHAGYDLKALVDADIADAPQRYPGLDASGPDQNIDFRRVRNLRVFFDRHAVMLTTDLADIAAWQPGDIVTFAGGTDHIGILSDKRNRDGIPWLIHNGGQPMREEDAIERLLLTKEITGHYRWEGAESAAVWNGL